MSRKTEKRVGAPKEYEVTVEIACDLCGATTGKAYLGEGGFCARDDWGTGRFDVDEVTVEHKTGDSYPEGGQHETVGYDICPRCWETKLVPWLESQGAKSPTRKQVEW